MWAEHHETNLCLTNFSCEPANLKLHKFCKILTKFVCGTFCKQISKRNILNPANKYEELMEKLGICVICVAAGKTCFLFFCLVRRGVFHPSADRHKASLKLGDFPFLIDFRFRLNNPHQIWILTKYLILRYMNYLFNLILKCIKM